MVDELPRLAALGVSIVELLPVHQFDPDEDNYWGYMPLVFGAVHRQYAAGDDAAGELAELVANAGLDIVQAVDVSTVRDAPHGKHTFRFRLANGESLKGRVCESAERAAQVARLSAHLDGGRFPRVLGHNGAALLEEWWEGRPLDETEWTLERLHECGEILGRLHAERRPTPPDRTPSRELERLEGRIGRLVDDDALDREEADGILASAAESIPTRVDWGLVHGEPFID